MTDEQKREVREGLKANEIKKISEADILNAAFNYGRTIARQVEEMKETRDDDALHDLENKYQVVISPLEPGDSLLMEIEQQLIEAYISSSGVQVTDNVQKIGDDSLLYTLPVMKTQQDGAEVFQYALGVRMSKKVVILSMDN